MPWNCWEQIKTNSTYTPIFGLQQHPYKFLLNFLSLMNKWGDSKHISLPSATKLRRLCFYRRVSVHSGGVCSRGLSARGGCPLWGVFAPGGCLLLGGVCSHWVSAPGGVCSWGSAPRGVCSALPRERRLLLLTVRILLECILVENIITSHP